MAILVPIKPNVVLQDSSSANVLKLFSPQFTYFRTKLVFVRLGWKSLPVTKFVNYRQTSFITLGLAGTNPMKKYTHSFFARQTISTHCGKCCTEIKRSSLVKELVYLKGLNWNSSKLNFQLHELEVSYGCQISKILRIPNLCLFFLWLQWLLSYQQFCD